MNKKCCAVLTAAVMLASVLFRAFPVQAAEAAENEPVLLKGLTYDHSMELQYADQFTVDYYEEGYVLVSVADSGRFLLVPENGKAPEDPGEDITVIHKPLKNIYLVATSAMDLFCALDSLDRISLSGTDASGWYMEAAKEALEDGSIAFAGKYSAPDYELILDKGCDLAIESTMIYHTPEVKEKLEQFGIPVLVERSSYESHPLGRTEWIKLYAALLDKEEMAEELFKNRRIRWRQFCHRRDRKNSGIFLYQYHGNCQCPKVR